MADTNGRKKKEKSSKTVKSDTAEGTSDNGCAADTSVDVLFEKLKKADAENGILPKDAEFDESYIGRMLAFFRASEETVLYKEAFYESGAVKSRDPVVLPPPFPTFELFAASIGTVPQTLTRWCEENARFAAAYGVCRTIQQGLLISEGLNGKYAAPVVRLVTEGAFEKQAEGQGQAVVFTLPPEIEEEAG